MDKFKTLSFSVHSLGLILHSVSYTWYHLKHITNLKYAKLNTILYIVPAHQNYTHLLNGFFFLALRLFGSIPSFSFFFLFHQLLSSLFQMKPLGPLVFQAQFCICVYLYRKLEADRGSQHWRWAWKFTREAYRLKFVFLTPASFVENGTVLEVQRPQ